ncbi:MAG TPA: D-alanyl-D-alanine carboxypeptidase family protein [Alphaproteobacteria bacterium]|nr:D-alanyl-D-alanine carboxypeptidase family protein [Alphaproteobacteria bacterium]
MTLRLTSTFAIIRWPTALVAIFGFFILFSEPASARYADIVLDAHTGQVLHEVNADTRTYPASLTKLMTLYLAFEALDSGRITLDQTVPVSAHAAAQAPSKLGLITGERIAYRDLLLGLVTKSANDAAVVVGEALGGTEPKFAAIMTEKAHVLGMNDTTFKNASGLPNLRQQTTARDMAKLAIALQRDFPQHYHYFSTREFTYKGLTHKNHNNLLGKVDGLDGMKTGFIQASGFNLVASAERSGRRYIAVVLGGETPKARDKEVAMLLDQAFAGTLNQGTTRVAALPNQPSKNLAAKRETTKTKTVAAARTKVTKAKATATAAKPGNLSETLTSWAIQVGAYSRSNAAHDAAAKALTQVRQIAANAEVAVAGGGKALYRARIIGLTQSTALEACRMLRQKGTDCMAMAPSGGNLAAVPN